MKSISIKAALIGLFALMILLIGGLGYIAITKIGGINENVEDFATHWLPARDLIARINVGLGRMRNIEAEHMVSASAEDMANAERRIIELKGQINNNLVSLQKLKNDDTLSRSLESLQIKLTAYDGLQRKFLDLSRKSGDNTQETGKLYTGEIEIALKEMTAITDAARDRITESAKSGAVESAQEYNDTRFSTLIAVGIGLVTAFGAMAFGVSRPIEQIT